MRRTSVILVGLAVALGATMLTACSDSADHKPSAKPPSSAAKVAARSLCPCWSSTWSTAAARRPTPSCADLDADVVGVLESYNRLPEIAKAAGYPYYDVGLQILSKYPILEPSGADGLYSYIEVRPGEAVAMINTHLDYVQDGPNRLNRGVARRRRAGHRGRGPALVDPEAAPLGHPAARRRLAGPPHRRPQRALAPGLDATPTVGAVAWPVSKALTDAGLRDSYREAHPDVVADPGHTWGGVAGSKGSPRRIDYAYVGGPVDVVSSEVVGEQRRRQRRSRLPEVDLGPPGRALPAEGHARPHPDHRRPLEPDDHRRRRGDRRPTGCRRVSTPARSG